MAAEQDKQEQKFKDRHYIKRPDLWPGSPNEKPLEEYQDALRHWDFWIDALELCKQQTEKNPDSSADMVTLYLSDLPDRIGPVDPIETIGLFCLCQKMAVYPPAWIMNDLYQRFSRYISDNMEGKDRFLGEYFEESRDSARRSDFKKYVYSRPISTACLNIHKLRKWFDCTQKSALDIVALQLEQAQKDMTGEWKSERIKGRAALAAEYADIKKKGLMKEHEVYWERNPPTNENRRALLRDIGLENLTGYPHLEAWLQED
ncbi:MAG: hypothetical protein C0618_04400 [Desulfuromonas sp.]|nr:MAG: hypothetical protein C0618_04400 [Desulfuromonas sp.]